MRAAPVAARFAVSAIFLLHGLIVSTWVSRVPDVQRQLGLSEGVFGTSLLGAAVGALLAMPATGALVVRFGSRIVTACATWLFCGALACIPLAYDAVTLTAALALFGAAAGAMDVAMNAQGVTVETSYGRSVLSSMHALFSIGGVAGALAGGQVAALGGSVAAHLTSSALACAAVCAAVARWMLGPESERGHERSGPVFSLPRGPVLAIGALGFCFLLCEGAMADWIAIYLRDSLSAGPAQAAAGFAVFSAAMAAGRLAGDRLTDRAGPVPVVRWGALLACAGLVGGLVAERPGHALAAFAAVGLGFATIVPNVYAAAGKLPGVAPGIGVAAVTTTGYFGFLVGPPLIGWLAEWAGLRQALFVLAALSAIGAALAGAVRPARRTIPGTFEVDPHG